MKKLIALVPQSTETCRGWLVLFTAVQPFDDRRILTNRLPFPTSSVSTILHHLVISVNAYTAICFSYNSSNFICLYYNAIRLLLSSKKVSPSI